MQRVAVIGLGRFGMVLARSLAQSGAEVIAVDSSRDLIDQIKDDVQAAVVLDSTDESALVSQEIHHADVIVIAIGENFEASLLTAAILRRLSTKRVICRAQTAIHAEIFRRIGADEIIQPENEAGLHLARRLVHPHLRELIDLTDGYTLVEVESPAAFYGKNIQQLQLRTRYEVNVVLIRRNDAASAKGVLRSYVPMPLFVIEAGDILVLLGTDASIASLPR